MKGANPISHLGNDRREGFACQLSPLPQQILFAIVTRYHALTRTLAHVFLKILMFDRSGAWSAWVANGVFNSIMYMAMFTESPTNKGTKVDPEHLIYIQDKNSDEDQRRSANNGEKRSGNVYSFHYSTKQKILIVNIQT